MFLLSVNTVIRKIFKILVQGGFLLYPIFLDVKIGYFLIKTEHKLLTDKWLNC